MASAANIYPTTIQAIRKSLGVSQEELGELLGVHGMTVSKWERGVLAPNPWQTIMIETFGMAASRQELVGREAMRVAYTHGIPSALYLLLVWGI